MNLRPELFSFESLVWAGLMCLAWFALGILLGLRLPRGQGGAPCRQGQAAQGRPPQGPGPQQTQSEPGEVYVGNLPYDVDERELKKLCARFGNVTSVRLIVDKNRGNSKGYGFARMASTADSKALVQGLNGKEVQGRRLVVSRAKSRSRDDD